MTTIAAFGVFMGLVWADLGRRGRAYLDAYKRKAKAIESHHDKKDWWEDRIEITDRPFQIQQETWWWSSSKWLLVCVPSLFSLLHVLLIVATWVSRDEAPLHQ